MAVKIVTSNGQTVQSFEDWKNGGKSPNGSQQAASYSGPQIVSYSGPQIVSSSGQTIQSFEEWRQNRTSGVTPGGDSVIIDWMDRYNRVMQGVSAYDKKRNGGFTRDASVGFGSEIDSLIADYDGIERYAADYGFRDAQKYLVQLKKLQNSIQGINDNFSQFEDEEEFSRYMDFLKNQDEMRNASFKDLTWNSLKRGYYNSLYGEESFKAMNNEQNQKEAYEKILAGEDYQFTPGNDFAGAVSSAMELIGQQARQFTHPRTVAAVGAAGIGAFALGQAGPQVLVPEEAITVPGAMAAAFTAGSAASNLEIEAGHAYNEMLEKGISEETARKVAWGVGGVNAGLELLQVDELLDAYKVTKASGATKTVAQKIFDELLKRGVDVAKETAQEVVQEGVTITGVQAASKKDTGEYTYSFDEVKSRLKDTAKSSAASFGLMNVPATAKNTASIAAEHRKEGIANARNTTVKDTLTTELANSEENATADNAEAVTEESSAVDNKMSATEAVAKNETTTVGVSKMETVQQTADIESFAQQFGTQANEVRRNYLEGQLKHEPENLQEYQVGFMAAYTIGWNGGKVESLSKHVPYLSQSQREIAFSLGRDAAAQKAVTVEAGILEARHYGERGYTMDQLAKHGADAAALSEEQRKAAWEEGRQTYLRKGNATPAATTGESGVWFDNGGGDVVDFADYDVSGVSETAMAGVRAAQTLQKLGIGGKFYFFESYVNEAGNRVYKDSDGVEKAAPNGWYDPDDGSIHIDLNAGRDANGLTLYTLSHELTHHLEKKNIQGYRRLAEFLVANYAEHGNVDAMVTEKQAELSRNREKPVSYETAYSEFIADSMEAMLSDGNVLEKLQEMQKTDRSLWEAIKEFFDSIAEKIRNAYKDLKPDSAEGRAVLEMKDQIEQIQQLFAEALNETAVKDSRVQEKKTAAKAEKPAAQEMKVAPRETAPVATVSEKNAVAAEKAVEPEVRQESWEERAARYEADRQTMPKKLKMAYESHLKTGFGAAPKFEKKALRDSKSIAWIKERGLDTDGGFNLYDSIETGRYTIPGTARYAESTKQEKVQEETVAEPVAEKEMVAEEAAVPEVRQEETVQESADEAVAEEADVTVAETVSEEAASEETQKEKKEDLTEQALLQQIQNAEAEEARLKSETYSKEVKKRLWDNFENIRYLRRELEKHRYGIEHGISDATELDISFQIHEIERVKGLKGQFITAVLNDLKDDLRTYIRARETGKEVKAWLRYTPDMTPEHKKFFEETQVTVMGANGKKPALVSQGTIPGKFASAGNASLTLYTDKYDAFGAAGHEKGFVNITNAYIVDAKYQELGKLDLDEIIRKAQEEKVVRLDGVIIKNVNDETGKGAANVYIAFEANRFRTVDEVTYSAGSQAAANVGLAVDAATESVAPDVMYSERKKKGMDDTEISAIQNIGRISVNAFTSQDIKATEKLARRYWEEMGVKSPFFRAWFGDWRVNDQTQVQIADQTGDARGVQRNDDTGWDITVSGQVFNETKSHRGLANKSAQPYLPYINDIVRKAVLLDSYGVGVGKAKSDNSLLMHSMYAVANIGNGPEVLKLYVEEMNNPTSDLTTKRSYQLQNIEKAFNASVRVQGQAPSSLTSTLNAVKIVADLFAAVKRYDTAFAPNPVSKAVNTDGTPLEMYHSTSNSGFTVFDTYGGNFGLFGKGSYFTDDPEVADTYTRKGKGQNPGVYGVYLSIKNPLDMDAKADLNTWKKAFEDADLDPSYLDGVVTNEDAFRQLKENLADEEYLRWEAEDIVTELIEGMGYDGITHIGGGRYGSKDGPKHRVFIAFEPEQIKSSTENIGTFDGLNPDIRYQDRASGTSDRELLAGALEGLTRNSDEYEFVQEYRKNARELDAQEAKLQELRRQIRELTFGKGPKDPKQLAQLQEEATKTGNRINIYDKKLLELEATVPLKRVLEREKEKARKAERKKGQNALAEYRENRRESESKKAAKRKIRKTVMELKNLLNRGDKKKNVKAGMTSVVGSVLTLTDALFMDEYSNRDMLRNGVNVEMTDAEEKLFREAQQILQQAESGAAIEGMEFTSEVDAMEKLKKLDQKLSSKIAGLKDVFARERKRLYGTTVSDLLGKLADEYSRLSEAEDGAVRAAKDENVYAHLLQLQKDVGGTTVRDMSLSQLEMVADAFTMVLTTVRNANKMFAKNLKFKRDTLAGMVIGEIGSAAKKVSKLVKPGKDLKSRFSWDNLKPVYAFERLGSETLKTLYQNIRKGQDVWSRDMQEADAFRREQYKKHGWKKWDLQKLHRFELESGKVELNLGQIMSLYAYSRREQALDHLLKGGFVFSKNTEVVVKKNGIQRRYLKKDATAYNLTADELLQVVDTLTKDQKAFVENMQTYLSDVMGGKGNEISLQMYGIKSYGEENYFPIRSAGQYLERAKEDSFRKEQGQISIVNSGFTKSTTPKASNPITLDAFMDVWAEHVNEMSMYHAFALPMEDFRRVYNYSSPNVEVGNSQSVNAAIENAFGEAATGYIDQLYKDLNGGAVGDNRETIGKKLVGLHKKAAVFASLSVVIQQPSAFVRAMALVDLHHFIGPKVDRQRHKALWAELKQYAPVAFVKEMGYFDTGMGRSAKDYLQAEDDHVKWWDAIRKVNVKAMGRNSLDMLRDSEYRDSVLSWAPAIADEYAWCTIWEAVKRETKAKNPGMDVKGAEFLQIAGERFAEVIDKTQVYDSVLSRSANMRSKSLHMNMLTSFLAEPTTSINMLEDALRKGDRKQIGRTVSAVYGSVLLNSLLVSLVYAARDDDEDETFWEKYLSSVAVKMLDGMNPITYYPFLRDIWSIGQGFDVERSDMSLITDFADAAKKVVGGIQAVTSAEEGEEESAMAQLKDALWAVVDSAASIAGLPVKNIRRDIEAARNLVDTISKDSEGRKTTKLSLKDAVLAEVMNAIPIAGLLYEKSKRDRLYGAIIAKDLAYADRLKAGYETDESYHSAIKLALRDHDSRIWEAAAAWNNNDLQGYMALAREILAEGNFVQDDVVLAIRAEASAMEESQSASSSTVKGYFTNEKFGVAMTQNNTAMADIIQKDLIDTKIANGKTRSEAEKAVESTARSQLKELFETGEITGTVAQNMLVRYGGYDREEAADRVAEWKYETEHPELDGRITYSQYQRWEADGKRRGISLETFTKVVEFRGGNTSDGVRSQEDVAAYINSMPISTAQKDALWCCFWSEKTLYKNAPWH